MKSAYEKAGVNIAKGDQFVSSIKEKVQGRYRNRVVSGVGGFSCLYDISKDKYLSCGTDGVGTKILLARDLNKHDSIGIDLVAMCVNDIICSGARPLFFMDYLASAGLDLKVMDQIIEGIIAGCDQCEIPLIGGETAEMPGLYSEDDYDLAGFAVGEVAKNDLIDGRSLTEGDIILGLGSSGLHSNGYSLARKLFTKLDDKKLLLEPTRIYTKSLEKIIDDFSKDIKGLAHITGGGIANISRINKKVAYNISSWPKMECLPKIIKDLFLFDLSIYDLFTTFNMGVGMVLVVSKSTSHAIKEQLEKMGEKVYLLGEVNDGNGEVFLNFKDSRYKF